MDPTVKVLLEKINPFAPNIVRLSLALVFLWFGFNQLFFPQGFMGYLPSWTIQDSSGLGHFLYLTIQLLPERSLTLILINGVIELILGLFLLVGKYTRLTAAILFFHLISITFSIGYNDIAVRDFGLSLVLLSIVMRGPDSWCLDLRKSA